MARATLFDMLSLLTLFISLSLAHPGTSPHLGHKRFHSSGLPSSAGHSGLPSSAGHSGLSSSSGSSANCSSCSYWLDEISHHGRAPYAPDASSYQVYRNVKDFGAVGDGVHDDTQAINAAISAGDRCAPGICQSSSTTPALVYFPPGTYLISSPIVDYYYTQLIGNPNCLPKIIGSADFKGFALIDGDPYGANGLAYGATNVFWRQVRNFILDTTNMRASAKAIGVHWPTGQATSLQNLAIHLSDAPGNAHTGLKIEGGSGGYMGDLVFYGGSLAADLGNQQFTMRNMTFNNAHTAISISYDWGWTFTGININNATVGINMTTGGYATSVGSILLFDSHIKNTETGVFTSFLDPSAKFTNGSIILENVSLVNVENAVKDLNGTTVLQGGTRTVAAFAQGHVYDPTGPKAVQGSIRPNARPQGLVENGAFYQRSKPQYEHLPVSAFLSARAAGAKGDGTTDDTAALNAALRTAKEHGKILFLDAGDYVVKSTIHVPAGSVVVGEAYPVIIGYGPFFSNAALPKPIVQLGHPGEVGSIEWSDAIVSTRGAAAGAILFEVNIVSPPPAADSYAADLIEYMTHKPLSYTPKGPTGLWDVHARVGGFAGSDLQTAQCDKKPGVTTLSNVNPECIASFLTMHITSGAANIYLENVWLWVADHDVESSTLEQITVYAGRGMLVESKQPIWLWGTAVEHHTYYQYQFSTASNVYMGQIQTETAYYQPNSPVVFPFAANPLFDDPIFPSSCYHAQGNFTDSTTFKNYCDGFGLRIVDSSELLVYGAGLYSFYDNYSVNCSNRVSYNPNKGPRPPYGCQTQIFSIEGASANINVYTLSTVGAQQMVDVNGNPVVNQQDNLNVYPNNIAVFRLDG